MIDQKKYLFVVGCPRSGTTALGNLLSTHDNICMGIERYGHRAFPGNFSLTPALFEQERFMRFEPGDTFYDTFEFAPLAYRDLNTSFANATYVGDKIPMLFRTLDQLFDAFGPDTKVVFIFRNVFDVAASYLARANNEDDKQWDNEKGVSSAIKDWRAAVAAYLNSPYREQILPVVYERLFESDRGMDPVLKYLDLDPTPEFIENYARTRARYDGLEKSRSRSLSGKDMLEISLSAPFGGYREIALEAQVLLEE